MTQEIKQLTEKSLREQLPSRKVFPKSTVAANVGNHNLICTYMAEDEASQ